MSTFCSRKGEYRQGFSLLELLSVLAIITLLLGLSFSTIRYGLASAPVKQTAAELVSTLRLAQSYARAHAVRTRVVFASQAFVTSVPQKKLPNGFCYAVYVFYTPTLPQKYGRWVTSSTGHELGISTPMSIPSGFVGQWIPCPALPGWKKISSNVTISADLLSRSLDELFYTPSKTWAAYPTGLDPLSPYSIYSIYPKNFYQTPIPTSYILMSTTTPPDELSSVIESGQPLHYFDSQNSPASLWPTNQSYVFFSGTDPLTTGNFEDASVGVDRRFFDLPGVEFDARGMPAFTWNQQIILQLSDKFNVHHIERIFIDRSIGTIRLQHE